jgi:hypothetical protein
MARGRKPGRAETRALAELDGVGKATLADLARLEVHDVAALARADPGLLYERLCTLSGTRQDPCVLDVLACAVAQARDPGLPPAQRKWWWWSRARKAAAPVRRRAR